MLLLFREMYDDLAVPLLPLHSNIEDDDMYDDTNLRALVAGGTVVNLQRLLQPSLQN